jgi:hypothetical protein
MIDQSSFAYTPEAYHKQLIQLGITSLFITLAMGLLLPGTGTQLVIPIRAASQSIPSGDLSVVGQPSLPAVTVDTIFKSLGSPMSGLGTVVVQASQLTHVDDAFALAVWWTETNDGAAGVGLADRNPGSVRGSVGYPSAFDGYTIYPSYSAAINYWFTMLKTLYINRGLSTVYALSYRYVGTSSSPLWAGKVVALMLKYRGVAPPMPVVPQGKRVTVPTVYTNATSAPLALQIQSQSDEGLVKYSASISKPASMTPPVLPPIYKYILIFFALLLALAIVAGVLLLDRRPPASNQQNDEFKGEDVQREGKPGANFPIRRTILLPSIPGATTPDESIVDGGRTGRSKGLLSRYGKTYQE